ncbi:uncharacterized protein LOC130802281 [Amaranthus tricolor]|uniref:uncharacterized protein LOC130802281 n=1 Tax=Amaranthus tricolor TaxID=29722 RepID=UPI002582B18D|nr:uncharacterized protein LOC130802281 [Amaranthus tricolor]
MKNRKPKMGNTKLKWTPEEEKALREGVNKHGVSKWKVILKDSQFRHILRSRSNIDLKDKWRNMNHAKSRRKPNPKSTVQDQKPSEVEVVAEAEAGAGFKIENEEDVFPSLHVIEEEIIAGLIADLEKNDPEHAEYCKDLQKLLENDEKADEILAYATEIMDRPLEDYGFSDLVI